METGQLRRSLTTGTGRNVREAVSEGRWRWPTRGLGRGYVQAGVIGLPKEYAYDFLLFCTRNPGPCPLIEVAESSQSQYCAKGADLSTALPSYRLYSGGQLVEQGHEVGRKYGSDMVWFVIGCSYSFEFMLDESGIKLRGMEEGRGNPLFITNRPCSPAGIFSGPLVVSMRPIPQGKAGLVSAISAKLPVAHGGPVHIGDHRGLGIEDLMRPDYGSPSEVADDEIPVFWACSVTPQAIAVKAKIPSMIAHNPGHMLVTDLRVAAMLS